MIQGFDDNPCLYVAIHQVTVTSRTGADVDVKADVLQAWQCERIIRIQRQIRSKSKTARLDMYTLLQILRDRVSNEIAVEDRARLQISKESGPSISGDQILANSLRNPVARERYVIHTHPVATAAVGSAADGTVEAKRIGIDHRHCKRAICS